MGKIISFGKCDKNYIYYILIFYTIIIISVIIFKFNKSINDLFIDNILLTGLLSYIAQSLFLFFQLILNKIIKPEKKDYDNNKKNGNFKQEFIYNESSDKYLSILDFIFLLLVCLLSYIVDLANLIIIKLNYNGDRSDFDIILYYHFELLNLLFYHL